MAKRKSEKTEIEGQKVPFETSFTTDLQGSDFLRMAKKHANAQDKAFQERFKNHEPYDPSEIEDIIKKAKIAVGKTTKRDEKLKHLTHALGKTEQAINNHEFIFNTLREEGVLNLDIEDCHYSIMDQLKSLKTNLILDINDPCLSDTDEADVSLKPSMQEAKNVKTSIQEQQPVREIMNRKQLADYLELGKSTIDHLILDGAIPYVMIGKSKRFKKSQIDKWAEENKPKNAIAKNNSKNQCHFIFKEQHLEELADKFVGKGYIDKTNANLLKDRFSSEPKDAKNKIVWKNDLKSLMSFIYLSDRLEFIDWNRTNKSNSIVHNTSAKEEKEQSKSIIGNKEVLYSRFVGDNFKLLDDSGFSKSEFTREWIEINKAITALREEILKRKSEIIEEINPSAEMTRKEAIIFYFKNRKGKYYKISNKIDVAIFDLVYEVWQSCIKKNES